MLDSTRRAPARPEVDQLGPACQQVRVVRRIRPSERGWSERGGSTDDSRRQASFVVALQSGEKKRSERCEQCKGREDDDGGLTVFFHPAQRLQFLRPALPA